MRTDSFAPLEITVRDVGGFPADAVGAIDCTRIRRAIGMCLLKLR